MFKLSQNTPASQQKKLRRYKFSDNINLGHSLHGMAFSLAVDCISHRFFDLNFRTAENVYESVPSTPYYATKSFFQKISA